jgi:hypothetical protein
VKISNRLLLILLSIDVFIADVSDAVEVSDTTMMIGAPKLTQKK